MCSEHAMPKLNLGTRVMLKATSARYYGGTATIIGHGSRGRVRVRRDTGEHGYGNRDLMIYPGDIEYVLPPKAINLDGLPPEIIKDFLGIIEDIKRMVGGRDG